MVAVPIPATVTVAVTGLRKFDPAATIPAVFPVPVIVTWAFENEVVPRVPDAVNVWV
jgi:hypothetical protein